MRILVLSRTPWRKDNSFGNTYSNYFENMDDVEIANVYLGDGYPDTDNKNVTSYFQISERKIVASVLKTRKKSNQIGATVCPRKVIDTMKHESQYDGMMQKIKKNRWSGFFVLREIAWKFGQIDYSALFDFITEFSPDIIFVSFYYAMYVDRVALRIKEHFDIPMVLEASIDIYSLKQLSFDPVFWINRLMIRSMIRKTVKKADKLYVISEKMKEDYSRFFSIDCEVLYKSPDLTRKLYEYERKKNVKEIVFLYTGNLYSGRWETLGKLGKAIHENEVGRLVIYTATPITEKMKSSLSFCELHEAVSQNEVKILQNDADVLVHAESFKLKDKLEVRYSISTKVMDYISCGRCVLAIGPDDIASVEYLKKNNLAECVTHSEQIPEEILLIKNNPDILFDHAVACSKYASELSSSYKLLQNDLLKISGLVR